MCMSCISHVLPDASDPLMDSSAISEMKMGAKTSTEPHPIPPMNLATRMTMDDVEKSIMIQEIWKTRLDQSIRL